MKQIAALLVPIIINGVTGAAAQVNKPANFVPEVKWQIDILATLDTTQTLTPTDAFVWDLDLYHLQRHPEIIDFLRSNIPNVNIICYFNAGLAQPSDCDWETVWQTPAYRGLLGNSYDPPFGEEKWINIKNQTAIDLIKGRVSLAHQLGCDGVDPDNIDGFNNDEDGENGTGFNLGSEDYINLMTQLSELAHSLTTDRGHTLLIGQKNTPELVADLEPLLDFAVLEDCKNLRAVPDQDPFCADFQPYIASPDRKPVFSIEYPTSLWDPSRPQSCSATGAKDRTQYDASCAHDEEAGGELGNFEFSEVLKLKDDAEDEQQQGGELNGCTQYCEAGFENGVVVTAVNEELDGDECKVPEGLGAKRRSNGIAGRRFRL